MKDKILSKILEIIREEGAPTVNVGSGNIAGTKEAGDDPGKEEEKELSLIGNRDTRKRWMSK